MKVEEEEGGLLIQAHPSLPSFADAAVTIISLRKKKKEVLLMLRGFALFFFLFTRLRSVQSLLLFSLSVFTYSSARPTAAAAGRLLSSSCCRVNLFLIIIPLRLTAEGSAAAALMISLRLRERVNGRRFG